MRRFGPQLMPPLGPWVTAAVCGVVAGRPVAVTWDLEHRLRLWDMETHEEAGPALAPDGPHGRVGLAYAELDGGPVAVLASRGLWVVDLPWGRHLRHFAHPDTLVGTGLCAVACLPVDGRVLAVTGGYERALRRWDLTTGEQAGGPLLGHEGVIRTVACGVLRGVPVAVTGDDEGVVALWDLAGGRRIAVFGGHDGQVRSVAFGVADGRPLAASGGRDETVRLWDLADPAGGGTVLSGHGHSVDRVAFATVSGRTAVVSAGGDLRIWDALTGRAVAPPLFDGRDNSWAETLACGTLGGRPVALSVFGDGPLRVWDLEEHRRTGPSAPARWATSVPGSWTDPATGDVYDLTAALVDEDGDPWEVVDFDGTEPIVAQTPVDPRVTFGIADAHAEYVFTGSVTTARNAKGHLR